MPRIVIHVDGGIPDVFADAEGIEVLIIDHDIDGIHDAELSQTLGGRYWVRHLVSELAPESVGGEFALAEVCRAAK